ARGHASPNAGWPEAAMAGALKLSLGGPRVYAGRLVEDATIGDGPREIGAEAIRQALTLYRVACALEIAVAIVGALIFAGL
ncbi:MAG: cobalamin biosynthesis protein, partial [Beijerinckiaceae bacterium]|nr:cobalamin biosynthesis protein [Beijerinckiaceae bacterium]